MPIRGSPYSANFSDKSRANSNEITGPLMQKYIAQSLEQITEFISQTNKGINLKDKDIKNDVKELLMVKEHIENVSNRNDEIIFWLD